MEKKIAALFIVFIYMLLFFHNPIKSWANSEQVLVEINGQKIMVSECNELPQKFFGIKLTNKNAEERFLNYLTTAILLAPEAKKLDLDEDPIIKQKIKAFRNEQLYFCLMQKLLREQATIDVRTYKNYILEYGREKVRFREIVVKTLTEAEQILQDISNGKDFEELAKEKSINKYSKNGGDTGFFIMNDNPFMEHINNIIFQLDNNQISGILKTTEGYAIFKAIERRDLTNQEKENEIAKLRSKLIKEKTDALLEKLRSQAKIKIFTDNITKIHKIKNFNTPPYQIELACVNGTMIRLVEVLSLFKNPEIDTLDNLRSPYFRMPSALKELINEAVMKTLMADEAIKMGLGKNLELKNCVKRFEEWELMSKYFTDVLFKEDISCTDKEIKEFYDIHKNDPQYKNIQNCVHARRIMVDDERIAKDILRQLKNGKDFAEMAKKHSILPYLNEDTGDLGYVEYGCKNLKNIIKSEQESLFDLSEGKISNIIPLSLGNDVQLYSIIKIEDKIERDANDYHELKYFMKRELLKRKKQQKLQNFNSQLRAKYTKR